MSGKLNNSNSISVRVDVPPRLSIHSLNDIRNVKVLVIGNRSPPNNPVWIFV